MTRKFLSAWMALLAILATSLAAGATSAAVETLQADWLVQLDGASYSQPLLTSSMVIVGDESGHLTAFDHKDGALLWSAAAAGGFGTAVERDGTVYAVSRDGYLNALRLKDGTAVWRFRTGAEAQEDAWDYFLSAPLVLDDQVVFGSGDGHVYAVERMTGTKRWAFRTDGIVHAAPVSDGGQIIVGSFDGHLYALDSEDGRQNWAFKTVGNTDFRRGAIQGTALVAGDYAYVGSRDYNLYAVKLETGTGAWNERTPSWVIATPYVADGQLYVGNSDAPRLMRFDALSGRRGWETPVGLNLFGAVQPVGERWLAAASFEGRVFLFDRDTGAVIARYDSPGSRARRQAYFDADDRFDGDKRRPVKTLADLVGLYDNFLHDLDGFVAPVSVKGQHVYAVSASGLLVKLSATEIE